MVATICLALAFLAYLAALGRSAMPRTERLPVTRWTARDLLGNVVVGGRRLIELHERNPMTPHRRTPLHR